MYGYFSNLKKNYIAPKYSKNISTMLYSYEGEGLVNNITLKFNVLLKIRPVANLKYLFLKMVAFGFEIVIYSNVSGFGHLIEKTLLNYWIYLQCFIFFI